MKINNFRGDRSGISANTATLVMNHQSLHYDEVLASSMRQFFSKLINLFFGYFCPVSIFLDSKNKQFPGVT